jgi:hypothetical protein
VTVAQARPAERYVRSRRRYLLEPPLAFHPGPGQGTKSLPRASASPRQYSTKLVRDRVNQFRDKWFRGGLGMDTAVLLWFATLAQCALWSELIKRGQRWWHERSLH